MGPVNQDSSCTKTKHEKRGKSTPTTPRNSTADTKTSIETKESHKLPFEEPNHELTRKNVEYFGLLQLVRYLDM